LIIIFASTKHRKMLKIFSRKHFIPKQTKHKSFWLNGNHIQVYYYFRSYQTLKNTENILQKIFYAETNGGKLKFRENIKKFYELTVDFKIAP
jgi:hypothetical protein